MVAELEDDVGVALDTLFAAYGEREAAAKNAAGQGRKVVGYVSNNVPEELILAAGLFPVQITGAPGEPTDTGDRYMENFFDGNVRSLFDRILRGHFNYLDLIVIPRSSESYLQLYYYLLEVRNWEPDKVFPEIYLLDILQTPFYITGRYDRGRMDALRVKLESVSGRPITDAALSDAIDLTNASRTALTELNLIRRRAPDRLTGGGMLRIIGASVFMDKADHTDLVRRITKSLRDAVSTSAKPRIMVKGSPHDNAKFYDVLEESGAAIVSDDHFWGERMFELPIEKHDDLMESLTLKFQRHSVSMRSYPQSEQDETFAQLVDRAAVDGVIFFLDEEDDTLGWDYPLQKAILDKKGKPHLYLKFQPYDGSNSAAQRAQVIQFLEQIAPSMTARSEIQDVVR